MLGYAHHAPDMAVPHARRTLLTSGVVDVPLDDNGAWGRTACGENHVADLHDALAVSGAHPNDRLRAVDIRECRSTSHDHGPRLADDLGPGRDRNSGGDEVGSVVEENYLAACELGAKSGESDTVLEFSTD